MACSVPGEIRVSSRHSEIDGQPVIVLSFQDNGGGFESDAKERIFDAFFTIKSKGTGLGMAIAK